MKNEKLKEHIEENLKKAKDDMAETFTKFILKEQAIVLLTENAIENGVRNFIKTMEETMKIADVMHCKEFGIQSDAKRRKITLMNTTAEVISEFIKQKKVNKSEVLLLIDYLCEKAIELKVMFTV